MDAQQKARYDQALKEVSYGQSLSREALRRLLKNHLAILGAFFVLALALACLFAPLIINQSPTRQNGWIGPQAPGYKHPAVISNNLFKVGEEAQTYPGLLKANNVVIKHQKLTYSEYRIVLKDNLIYSITQREGALHLEELSLDGSKNRIKERLFGGRLGRSFQKVSLKLGMKAPEDLFADNKKVLILRSYQSDSPQLITT
ncbi:MAG: hypothetical protein HQL32_06035, partial [Planctomycetes bacterium]|nr:hypothetical protein [Planctomycetota bacterium]